MKKAADEVLSSKASERPVVDTAQRDLMALLNSNSYQKGGWVLHQLRGIVGDSAFFAGLRRYYTTYRDSTACLDRLREGNVRSGGEESRLVLPAVADATGLSDPRRSMEAQREEADLDIAQTQKPEWGTYRIPNLELLVDGKPVRVDVDGRKTHTVIDGIGRSRARSWWIRMGGGC